MSIRYICRKDLDLCLVVWNGHGITSAEWGEHLRRLAADPDISSVNLLISDLRFAFVDASFGKPEISQGAEFISGVPRLFQNKKIAIVASNEFEKSVFFGDLMKRMAADIIVFNALDVACAWLGLDAEAVAAECERIRE